MKSSLPNLPYNWEIIKPSLRKPGLRVFGPETPKPYGFELVRRRKITREILRRFGFILFENNRALDMEGQSGRDAIPDGPHMFFHQDLSIRQKMRDGGVIALQSPPPHIGTQSARTIVGDMAEVFSAIVRALTNESPPVSCSAMIQEVAKIDPANRSSLGKFFFEWADILLHHKTLVDFFFRQTAESIYEHNWGPDQLLLIDNVEMVHGRANSAKDATGVKEPSLLRGWYRWSLLRTLVPYKL